MTLIECILRGYAYNKTESPLEIKEYQTWCRERHKAFWLVQQVGETYLLIDANMRTLVEIPDRAWLGKLFGVRV